MPKKLPTSDHRYSVRQDRLGKFYVFDWEKNEEHYMPSRKAARARARELNDNEPRPPQAA